MRIRKPERVCARCGKVIRERTCFVFMLQERKRYSSYIETQPLGLYFHLNCVKNISVAVSDMWDLVRVLNKLGAT